MSLKAWLNQAIDSKTTESGLDRLIEFVNRKREGLSKKEQAQQVLRKARIQAYERTKQNT